MDNYKIINTHTNEIIKALNDLGYVWTPKKFDEQDCLVKAHWILAKETGEIAYSSGTHIDSPLVFVNGNLKLTPFTLKQQSKIDPFDDLLRLNLWLNSYSLFIF
ncbi:hypothetical protein [Acinetobacter baumannii]|uniref:hypothetical protein n=1 Tax=Acinetobacter baumannii TaxID=470 RepID=UPI0002E34805|nr:hypothetical protein [Acinetobacter baumannii]